MPFNFGLLVGVLAVIFPTLQPAHASIRTWNMFGVITTAEEDNRFGLHVGDELSGRITMDTSVLTGHGFETLSLRPDLDLGLHIGHFSFDESDDSTLFGPAFVFFDGNLVTMIFRSPSSFLSSTRRN
jgi:hypothetical protein